jgi:hypothetical protein
MHCGCNAVDAHQAKDDFGCALAQTYVHTYLMLPVLAAVGPHRDCIHGNVGGNIAGVDI